MTLFNQKHLYARQSYNTSSSATRVDEDRLRESSPVLARLFLQSIFISVDISIREGHLFCDCLCDNGPLYSGQVSEGETSQSFETLQESRACRVTSITPIFVKYKIITQPRDAVENKKEK